MTPIKAAADPSREELLALADEIEASEGLVKMQPLRAGPSQLGIKKTAQIVSALRRLAAPAGTTPKPFYGAECPAYPACDGGCGLGCTKEIERTHAAPPEASFDNTSDMLGYLNANDWRSDPSADERWNTGLDFAMTELCKVLGVETDAISWDAATETVDGDVRAVLGNILRAKYGENWSPASPSPIPEVQTNLSGTDLLSHDEVRGLIPDAQAREVGEPSSIDLWNAHQSLSSLGHSKSADLLYDAAMKNRSGSPPR